MAPTPQSRFIEGSMNDRASNAPPPDFLGTDAEATAEYERQFALDWQPPDLDLQYRGGNSTGFVGSPSAMFSAATSRHNNTHAPAAWPKGHKQNSSSFLAPLWGGVKERLSLNRSKSSNNVTEHDEDGSHHAHNIRPTFKHQRSESINGTITRPSRVSRHADSEMDYFSPQGEGAKLKKFSSAAAIPSVSMAGPVVSDPARRPTREEIAANYQSLLASGFFGNRAIQSTRFSPPGQQSSTPSAEDSIAQRVAENEHEHEQQGQHQDRPLLPLPDRLPPPPPPSRAAPPPPPVAPIGTAPSFSFVGMPVSPGSKDEQQASNSMPPPSSPPKRREPGHKPSQSFSSIPYTSTRPGTEPTFSPPSRPPPVSLARFSLDSARKSLDFQLSKGSSQQRGIKRPFTAANDSDMSLDRPSYDMINGDGSGTLVTVSENGGHESGARKLVKKLRKSASRISIDLSKTISRPTSTNIEADTGDSNDSGSPSASRQSMSSTIRRSFSWRLGRSAQGSAEDNKRWDPRSSSDSMFKGNEEAAVCPFRSERFPPPSLPVILDGPESPERNKLKKRDIRGRRWRRNEAGSNKPSRSLPVHLNPVPILSPAGDGDAAMVMDWQSARHSDRSNSRSRSRPRRSELSIMMQSQAQSRPQSQSQSQSRPGTAHSTDSSFSLVTSAPAPFERRRSAEVTAPNAGGPGTYDRMEGVEQPIEFVIPSFHFPNRIRPGNPLTVIPDANRGIPSVPNIPGEFRDVKIVARERGENGDDDIAGAGAVDGAQAGTWPGPQAVF